MTEERKALEALYKVVTDANRDYGMCWGKHFNALMKALFKTAYVLADQPTDEDLSEQAAFSDALAGNQP